MTTRAALAPQDQKVLTYLLTVPWATHAQVRDALGLSATQATTSLTNLYYRQLIGKQRGLSRLSLRYRWVADRNHHA